MDQHQQQQLLQSTSAYENKNQSVVVKSESNYHSASFSPSSSALPSSSFPIPSPVHPHERRYSNRNSYASRSPSSFPQSHSSPHSSSPDSSSSHSRPASLTSAFKLVKTFNGDSEKFIKWRHEIKMAFKYLGWYYQLETNYFEPIQSKDRYSSIYIPSGETISARLHREEMEEENELKLQTKLSLLSDQQRLDIDSGYALIWGTLGESLSDLLLSPNSQEGNPYDLYTNICLKF